MGLGVTVERTEDVPVIRDLVLSCWDTIAEDGQESDDWHPNVDRSAYLLARVDGRPAGILSISSANASILHVHIHIDPQMRDHKYEIGKALIEYVKEYSEFLAMVVYIPTIYPNVSGFATRLGFVNVGTAKRGFRKDGDLHDLTIMQMELERAR